MNHLWWLLLIGTPSLYGQVGWEPDTQEEVDRVCGFCHFEDFYHQETGNFLPEQFLSRSAEILRRLQLPEGHEEIMPPSRSSLQLKPGFRERIIQQLATDPSP